jgi:hypothetical protein
MLLQMGGDQLIVAGRRALQHHPDHADLRAAVAIDRDRIAGSEPMSRRAASSSFMRSPTVARRDLFPIAFRDSPAEVSPAAE